MSESLATSGPLGHRRLKIEQLLDVYFVFFSPAQANEELPEAPAEEQATEAVGVELGQTDGNAPQFLGVGWHSVQPTYCEAPPLRPRPSIDSCWRQARASAVSKRSFAAASPYKSIFGGNVVDLPIQVYPRDMRAGRWSSLFD